jgi:polyisoprenoid-binding protein YceI/rhodanese-related sulfurtransferase
MIGIRLFFFPGPARRPFFACFAATAPGLSYDQLNLTPDGRIHGTSSMILRCQGKKETIMAPSPTVRRISAGDLQQRLQESDRPLLLDTLTNDHFKQVHIPGAQNACVFEVTFLDQVAALGPDKDDEIVVYGSRAETREAETAADKLTRAGYRRVAVLESGLAGWRADGFTVDGHAPDALDLPPDAPIIEKRRYTVDTETSSIEWVGRNPNTHHTGSLRLIEGTMEAGADTITGRFTIDLKSMRNTSLEGDELQPVLIAHLLSDDFFWAERFPTATFALERLTPISGSHLTTPNYTVEGTLKMMGVGVFLQFPATLTTLPDERLAAEAHFDIDRTHWNIIYGSSRFFDHLGMHVVFDLISVQLKLVTV